MNRANVEAHAFGVDTRSPYREPEVEGGLSRRGRVAGALPGPCSFFEDACAPGGG
jgi:hypothetical protein